MNDNPLTLTFIGHGPDPIVIRIADRRPDGAPWTFREHLYADLDHAIRHAAPDDPTEDADGYITWNGKSPNAMNSAETEDE